MPAEEDTIFGQLAVSRGHVTREQLDAAKAVVGRGLKRTLAGALVHNRVLTLEQVHKLKRAARIRRAMRWIAAYYWVFLLVGAALAVAGAMVLILHFGTPHSASPIGGYRRPGAFGVEWDRQLYLGIAVVLLGIGTFTIVAAFVFGRHDSS